jgi:hypothetical protein
MEIECIVWDGTSLSTVIAIENRRVTCTIPRDTVQAMPDHADAAGWELDRHRQDIFERVKQILQSKIGETARPAESMHLQIMPADLA